MNQKKPKPEPIIIRKNRIKQTENLLSVDALSQKEKKSLVDSLVDPIFVINNANSVLKKKLEKFVDSETRQNFYMIDRAQKKLIDSINQLRYNNNPS